MQAAWWPIKWDYYGFLEDEYKGWKEKIMFNSWNFTHCKFLLEENYNINWGMPVLTNSRTPVANPISYRKTHIFQYYKIQFILTWLGWGTCSLASGGALMAMIVWCLYSGMPRRSWYVMYAYCFSSLNCRRLHSVCDNDFTSFTTNVGTFHFTT